MPKWPPVSARAELALEADGRINRLPSAESLSSFAATLLASEANPVINAADSDPGSSGVVGRPGQEWSHGNKKLLVILVDFSDLPESPVTHAYIENTTNGPNRVRAFYQGNSFGKTDLISSPTTDITPILRLSRTAASYATTGDNLPLHGDAHRDPAATGDNRCSPLPVPHPASRSRRWRSKFSGRCQVRCRWRHGRSDDGQ